MWKQWVLSSNLSSPSLSLSSWSWTVSGRTAWSSSSPWPSSPPSTTPCSSTSSSSTSRICVLKCSWCGQPGLWCWQKRQKNQEDLYEWCQSLLTWPIWFNSGEMNCMIMTLNFQQSDHQPAQLCCLLYLYNQYHYIHINFRFVELLCIKSEIPLANTESAVEEVVKVSQLLN